MQVLTGEALSLPTEERPLWQTFRAEGQAVAPPVAPYPEEVQPLPQEVLFPEEAVLR